MWRGGIECIYIYIYVCVCVCVCVRARARTHKISERNFRLHLEENGVLEMGRVEFFELVLGVHQTERYHIKRTENNAIDFALRVAANLVRPFAKHIKCTPYGTSFPSTCLHPLCPVYTKG